MDISLLIYLIFVFMASLLLGYELRFTEATKLLGVELFKTHDYDFESNTGFQDAITPPWSNFIAYSAYALTLVVIVYGFYVYGWIYGIVIIIGLFLCTTLLRLLILPKPNSEHFCRIIVSSMANRYADYVKSNDLVRAEAMADLLSRFGIDVDDINR